MNIAIFEYMFLLSTVIWMFWMIIFSPWQVVGLNFSSATTPELLLKTFDQYCEYKRTPNGVVLSPIQMNKWLVLFCDEINLPNMDKYSK